MNAPQTSVTGTPEPHGVSAATAQVTTLPAALHVVSLVRVDVGWAPGCWEGAEEAFGFVLKSSLSICLGRGEEMGASPHE